MELLTLRTGEQALDLTVKTVKHNLKTLFEKHGLDGMLAVYDLKQLCTNPNHKTQDDYIKLLKDYSLVSDGNQIHDETKKAILACLDGEGMDIHIVDPLQ